MTNTTLILDDQVISVLLEKLVLPLIVAVIGWLVKDVIVDLFKTRQNEVRLEQLFRLREIYCPLFFWSGVALFDSQKRSGDLALEKLSALMEKSATLMPYEHYYVFIKLIERLAGQSTVQPSKERVDKARDYVYSQIEQLNFVLFRQSDDFDPKTSLDVLKVLKRTLRFGLGGAIHVGIWALVIALIYLIYLAVADNYYALVCLAVLFVLIVAAEVKRRISISNEMEKRMKR
jgi:hypothetical protein